MVVLEAPVQVCCELGVVYVLQQGLERRHHLVLWPNKHNHTFKPHSETTCGSLPAQGCGGMSRVFVMQT